MEKERVTIEKLFESSGLKDSKHILNTNPDKIIDFEILKEIEESGVSLERLKSLSESVDVYKYNTQITIHGKFPSVTQQYIGNYKNLFQNKNESVGVKWSAIDLPKRDYIYKCASRSKKFYRMLNSTVDKIYLNTSVNEKPVYDATLLLYKEMYDRIDNNLFYGSKRLTLTKSSLFGLVMHLDITINAIAEENVALLVEQITGEKNSYFLELFEKEKQELIDEQQRRADKLDRIAKGKQDFIDGCAEELTDMGFVQVIDYKPSVGDVFCKFIYVGVVNGQFRYEIRYKKIVKKSFNMTFYDDCNCVFEPINTHKSLNEKNMLFTGWVKKFAQVKPTKPELMIVNYNPNSKNEKLDVRIEKYSEKCFVVVGADTKAIKDDLKQLGCKFANNLKCGPCWMFYPSKYNEVNALISKFK